MTEYEKKQPIVETKMTLSEDKKWFIHKTIITDIKSVNYINKVLESSNSQAPNISMCPCGSTSFTTNTKDQIVCKVCKRYYINKVLESNNSPSPKCEHCNNEINLKYSEPEDIYCYDCIACSHGYG